MCPLEVVKIDHWFGIRCIFSLVSVVGPKSGKNPPERFDSRSHRSVLCSPEQISANQRAHVLQVDLSSASDHGALRGLQQLGGLSEGSSSSSSGSSSRGNSSTTAAAGPETVSTAAELVAAVTSGAEDIRVTEHMDLTGLPGYGVLDPGVISTWNLRSIRVRSSQQHSEPLML